MAATLNQQKASLVHRFNPGRGGVWIAGKRRLWINDGEVAYDDPEMAYVLTFVFHVDPATATVELDAVSYRRRPGGPPIRAAEARSTSAFSVFDKVVLPTIAAGFEVVDDEVKVHLALDGRGEVVAQATDANGAVVSITVRYHHVTTTATMPWAVRNAPPRSALLPDAQQVARDAADGAEPRSRCQTAHSAVIAWARQDPGARAKWLAVSPATVRGWLAQG